MRDVTLEILGERRQEWREGYDAGLKSGTRRVLESAAMAQIVSELVLLREVAAKLGAKADYWMARAQEMELEADKWYGVVADVDGRITA